MAPPRGHAFSCRASAEAGGPNQTPSESKPAFSAWSQLEPGNPALRSCLLGPTPSPSLTSPGLESRNPILAPTPTPHGLPVLNRLCPQLQTCLLRGPDIPRSCSNSAFLAPKDSSLLLQLLSWTLSPPAPLPKGDSCVPGDLCCVSLTPFTDRCKTQKHRHTHTNRYNHTNTQTHTHPCTHTYVGTYLHAYTQMDMYGYIFTHKHTLNPEISHTKALIPRL